MRLVAILYDDQAVMAVAIDRQGDYVVPVSALSEFYRDVAEGLESARAVINSAHAGAAVPLDEVTKIPFVPSSCRVFCAGVNFKPHIGETGQEVPSYPEVFGRYYNSLTTDGVTVAIPPREPGLDWEGELAVVVGSTLSDVNEAIANAAILGYTCLNDLTGRSYQRATRNGTLGKNGDETAPIGPVLVTADEISDLSNLRVRTRVNDWVAQDASLGEMIFSPGQIISYISGALTVQPGDIVSTGTPSGVGISRDPVRLLGPGDAVEVEIDRIGTLQNWITAGDVGHTTVRDAVDTTQIGC